MALAHADPVAAAVDRDQRDQQEVWRDRRCVGGRLKNAPGSGIDRLAGAKRHPAVAVDEGGEGDGPAHPAGPIERREYAHLVLHREVAGDDARLEQKRVENFVGFTLPRFWNVSIK